MKKILKIIGITVLALVILLVRFQLYDEHVWKLWGFEKCTDPDGMIYINEVSVAEKAVHIEGGTVSSAERYNGYVWNTMDDSLYVGIRYGLFEGEGADFSFDIKGDFSDIQNIILTNGEKERIIWNRGGAENAQK